MKSSKLHLPKSRAGRILLSLVITAVIGFLYFYVTLPAINPHTGEFYEFLGLLCIVYLLSSFILAGAPSRENTAVQTFGDRVKDWLRFVKRSSMAVGIFFLAVIGIALVGQLISLPIFRASAYRDLLTVETGNFAQDVTQISFSEIPTLDRQSAEYLGDRQMGTLSDMVSQFEYSNDSTQINYQGRPVRVAPIDYADLFKWFTNRREGLPAYVVVDMVTQEATVKRLPEGMKYSFSEPLNRNIMRHLRFHYPTMMFATPEFEINEEGHPFWVAPRIVRTIGLFGGTDIQGAVLVDAVTGECKYYEEVPNWVDNLYNPLLIMQQYDFHGTLINGFINSILGQRGVTKTTQGYNYIAMNDDVYAYTGVTSANADQSNLGFLLCNMRTKETHFYEAPGATEEAAKLSAMGVVQDLGYVATFPLLLNIAGEPTYFIPLKDNTELVKSYAMVNVAQYQIVVTGDSVSACEQKYIQKLTEKGIATPDQPVQDSTSGVVRDIRTVVIGGNTYYLLQLDNADDNTYYSVCAAQNRLVITLNVGDKVEMLHTAPLPEEKDHILDVYEFKITNRAASSQLPSASAPIDGGQTAEAEPAQAA